MSDVTAKDKFKFGDIVIATQAAFDNGLWVDNGKIIEGVVIGFCKSALSVRIVAKGRVTPSRYHIDFWEVLSHE